ncbi:MAG: hypothetical protein JWQ20_2112, partial [Conexibacter sp.]|nr:hypothetical protein [Conexibacter sp.]
MLMHRQAPIALSALAACAVMASGAVLLRQQILDFSSLSQVRDSVEAPQLAIPHERATEPRAAPAAPGHAPRHHPAPTGAAATAVVIDALAIAGRVTLAVPAGRSGPTDAGAGAGA